MKKIDNPSSEKWAQICNRPEINTKQLNSIVDEVFKKIQSGGNTAVKDYTKKFDKAIIDELIVTSEEIQKAENQVKEELKEAITLAKNNIEKFHKSQELKSDKIETATGVVCWQETRAIEKIGLYIPGGSAPLFSTILMLGIPAKIAGCKEIILCTPPDQNGEINPAILYTANLIGIDKIFKIGGIQAIAAMSYGTETIPQVYKIFGPGNQYVTAAKQKALNLGISIDMPAGPSELLVLADQSSNPAFVASDLLSQAEHGEDSQVICVVNSKKLADQIEEEVDKQLNVLERKAIASVAIENSSIIYFDSRENSIRFINQYAPEHFILCSQDEDYYLNNLENAGSVFIGNYTPESAGDYASGTNHTLPTNGFAKSYSGVNLDAFCKKITFQKINKEGIQNIGNAIELMADAEGLQAHKNAVTLRLKEIKNS